MKYNKMKDNEQKNNPLLPLDSQIELSLEEIFCIIPKAKYILNVSFKF